MARLSSVNVFADRWLQTDRPLDILCNNAGIGGNPGDAQNMMVKTEDGFKIVHQVNFLSHCLLTLALLAVTGPSDGAEVVCTTSCMMFFGTFDVEKFNGAGCKGEDFYCNNKLFLQVWLTELQLRLRGSERYSYITINGRHPGYTNTGIWHITREPGWINWMWHLLESFLAKTLAGLFAISAEQGSYAITHAATSPECGPGIRLPQAKDDLSRAGGKYFNRIWEAETMPQCFDPESRLLVWMKVMEELSLEESGLLDKHVIRSSSRVPAPEGETGP
jgi:NAD(P)-dependent dehydrogenase (short-subunit alcohol dehydrogenase family)